MSAIILYDGICSFCDSSVLFILKRDNEGFFKFAPLQSKFAKDLMVEYQIDPESMKSMVLVENGKAYLRSTAGLRIFRKLGFPWSLSYMFIIVPPFLRDFVYDIIAKNRYRWFGKKEACEIPRPEWKSRMIAD